MTKIQELKIQELERVIARLKAKLPTSRTPHMTEHHIERMEDWLWELRHPIRAWFRPKNIRHRIATFFLRLARWFEPGIGYDYD